MNNELLNLLATIVIFGLVTGLINAFIPMPSAIKSLLNLVVVVILVIYILQFFGIIQGVLPIWHLLK